jgi:hypothetical protein
VAVTIVIDWERYTDSHWDFMEDRTEHIDSTKGRLEVLMDDMR